MAQAESLGCVLLNTLQMAENEEILLCSMYHLEKEYIHRF